MSLSNTAVPIYYGKFRDEVVNGKIPVCKEIAMEMNRIDDLIANPGIYYDNEVVEGFIKYCEKELTLTDGSDLTLLDTFKIWAEQIFGWYYFVERSVYEPFGIVKVIQGAKTESVPLGELKKLSEERMLLFDEELMSFAMGNCITLEDTNGNRKLLKKRYEQKIDAVAAMMDAYIAYKLNKDAFE